MSITSSIKMNKVLVVDLDGTLTTDTLYESMVSLLRKNPFLIFKIFYFIFKGKLVFKNYINTQSNIDPASFPYNKKALSYIAEKKKRGYHIVLATGAPASIANKVSKYLGLFDATFSSTNELNLTGVNKAKILQKKYGNTFTYMGNSSSDNHVWDIANKAIVVSNNKNILKDQTKLELHIKNDKNSLKQILKAMRPHHWIKNLLVFVAGAINFEITTWNLFLENSITFIAFCCIASCTYLLNDIIDIPYDRAAHDIDSEKKKRPIASGNLDILPAIVLCFSLFTISLILSSTVAYQIPMFILGYFLLNILYSLYLKKIIFVDILCLTFFYIIRIDVGFFSNDLKVSFWLISFAFFLFLGLAFLKRYIEISLLSKNQSKKVLGRSYNTQIKHWIYNLSMFSNISSIACFALYSQSSKAAIYYQNTNILALAALPISLFFIRLYVKISKSDIKTDIVSWIYKDAKVLAIAVLFFIIFITAKFYE